MRPQNFHTSMKDFSHTQKNDVTKKGQITNQEDKNQINSTLQSK